MECAFGNLSIAALLFFYRSMNKWTAYCMMSHDSQKLGFMTSQDIFKLITSVYKQSCSFLIAVAENQAC